MSEDLKPTKEYEQFQNSNSFKNSSLNLEKDIARAVMFENGIQWNMDEDIAEYPKITVNIIKQIGKARKSNIMSNEYSYLVNTNNFDSVRTIQSFLKYLSDSLNLKVLDLKAVNDDYTKGTAIMYFYWDAEKRGFMRNSGELRAEIIDVRNFAVASPYIQNIQDQEWVIFVSEEKIGSISEKYGIKSSKIIPDDYNYLSKTQKMPIPNDEVYGELKDHTVNVYTKFYRNEDGEVLFNISTKYNSIRKAVPINPYYFSKTSKEMPNTTSLFDEKNKDVIEVIKNDKRSKYIWNLYPFARLCLNERDNCFYGTPIVNEYIEAQKSINNHFSVYDKAIQDNVLGGYVFREGVCSSDDLIAGNGQMVELKGLAPGEAIGNVFQRMPVANVPQDSASYSQNLITSMKNVAGASNVVFGQSDYSGQSGKQTELLLERARQNSTDSAMLFEDFKIQQAYIMFLFAKFFFDNKNFTIIEHGMNEDKSTDYSFDGREYLEDDVLISIKVGSAPSFSEYTDIELVGQMVQTGQIPFEVYLSMLPEGYVSNKQELIKMMQESATKQIAELQNVIKQQQDVMNQMVEEYRKAQQDRANVKTIYDQLQTLQGMFAEVAANSIKATKVYNEKTKQMSDDMAKLVEMYNNNLKK